MTNQMNIRIDDETRAKFAEIAESMGMNAGDTLRALVATYETSQAIKALPAQATAIKDFQ